MTRLARCVAGVVIVAFVGVLLWLDPDVDAQMDELERRWLR